MVLRKCDHCGFWLAPKERWCPDCGWGTRGPGGISRASWGALGAGLAGVLGLGIYLNPPHGTLDALATVLGAVALYAGGAVAAGSAWEHLAARARRRGIPAPLQAQEARIREWLDEVPRATARLNAVRSRVEGEPASPEWEHVLATLAAAADSHARQRDRCQMLLWRISLLRWQNQVDALTSGWNGLSFDGCEQRLRDLADARQTGERLQAEWSAAPQAGRPEAAVLRDGLERSLGQCEELRKGLIARQAQAAVQVAPGKPSPAREPDLPIALPAGQALGEFSAAFAQLSDERARLQAELEVAAHLGR